MKRLTSNQKHAGELRADSETNQHAPSQRFRAQRRVVGIDHGPFHLISTVDSYHIMNKHWRNEVVPFKKNGQVRVSLDALTCGRGFCTDIRQILGNITYIRLHSQKG